MILSLNLECTPSWFDRGYLHTAKCQQGHSDPCCSGSGLPVQGLWWTAAGLHVTRVQFLADDGSEVPSQPVGMEGISEVVFWTGGWPTPGFRALQTSTLMQCRRLTIVRALCNACRMRSGDRLGRLVDSRFPSSMAMHGRPAVLCSQAAGAAPLLIRAGRLHVQ